MAQTWRVTGYRSSSGRAASGRPPLDSAAAERLALFYVGRYATTRARLRDYLHRKLRERGAGAPPPDVDAIVSRMAALGYVDDASFAAARAAGLQRRGYGARRIGQALRGAGIDEEDAAAAQDGISEGGWDAAIAFARRRRIGPFAAAPADPDQRRRALGALMRAGHSLADARRIVSAPPGTIPERDG